MLKDLVIGLESEINFQTQPSFVNETQNKTFQVSTVWLFTYGLT